MANTRTTLLVFVSHYNGETPHYGKSFPLHIISFPMTCTIVFGFTAAPFIPQYVRMTSQIPGNLDQ